MIKFENKLYNISGLNIPEVCPTCGSDIIVQNNGIVRCSNAKCPKIITHKVAKFFNSIDVRGAGDHFVEKCSKDKNVEGISSILRIALSDTAKDTFESWAGNDSGNKNGSKVLSILVKRVHETTTVSKFLSMMDLEGFGEKKLALFEGTKLFNDFYSGTITMKDVIDKFNSDTDVQNVNGMSPEIKDELYEELKSDSDDIVESSKYFVFKSEEASVMTTGKLSGLSFCFHGTLSEKRSVLEQLVKDNGGTIGNVTKNLSYLVCNEQNDTSNKVVKAKQLGIKMITEAEFRAL